MQGFDKPIGRLKLLRNVLFVVFGPSPLVTVARWLTSTFEDCRYYSTNHWPSEPPDEDVRDHGLTGDMNELQTRLRVEGPDLLIISKSSSSSTWQSFRKPLKSLQPAARVLQSGHAVPAIAVTQLELHALKACEDAGWSNV